MNNNTATTKELIEIFNDTQNWITSNPDLALSVIASEKNTEVFYEDDYPKYERALKEEVTIEVSQDRSFQAAVRLARQYPDKKITVLNFGNPVKPGGGVKCGANAQEESLCRTSTLYPLLCTDALKNGFYKYHRDIKSSKASDSIIYLKDVIICKSDDEFPVRLPKSEWRTVDVITMAAPDMLFSSLTGTQSNHNSAELFGYHVKRAIHMLTVAASKGSDILVLGAFGCGAFMNDPKVVSAAYKTAVSVFPDVFDHIEFAVWCKTDNTNYDVFRKCFASCEDTGIIKFSCDMHS